VVFGDCPMVVPPEGILPAHLNPIEALRFE